MADDKLTRYQKQQKGKQGQSSVRLQGQLEKKVTGTRERGDRTQQRLEGDKIDSIFGFDRFKEVSKETQLNFPNCVVKIRVSTFFHSQGLPRVGWLLNYLPIVSKHLMLQTFLVLIDFVFSVHTPCFG